jgi:hypothetical protein
MSYLSERRARRRRAEWQSEIRIWAITTARSLAIDLHCDHSLPIRSYKVGLVLWDGEQAWAEIPVKCSADTPVPIGDGRLALQTTPWLVTSERVAGRLQPNTLRWWTWDQVIGMQVDLRPGRERVCLDIDGSTPVYFESPGVAPLAVAAVYRLHGPMAVIEHPSLAPLRTVTSSASPPVREGTESRVPMLEVEPPKPRVQLW